MAGTSDKAHLPPIKRYLERVKNQVVVIGNAVTSPSLSSVPTEQGTTISKAPNQRLQLPKLLKPLPEGTDPIGSFLTGQLSAATKRTYATDLKYFLLYLDAPGYAFTDPESMVRTLLTVDRNKVAFWRDDLLKTHAPATIIKKMAVMASIYRYLKDLGFIKQSPFDWVKRPKGTSQGTPAFTRAQAEVLLSMPDASTKMGLRDRCLLMLLLFCALRRSEVIRIKAEDFIQDFGYTVLKVHGKGQSGKVQKVKVPQIVWNTIQEYVKKYHVLNDEFIFSGQSRNPVYCKTHRPISAGRVYLIVKRYCEQAGYDSAEFKFSPHSARATSITLALDGGANIHQVQAFARHKDPETTIRYYRNKENLIDNAVDYIHLNIPEAENSK